MDRREVLKSIGLIVGGTVVGAEMFLSGCTNPEEQVGILSNDQMALMEEIAETILPKTAKSPGAKEAKVGIPINNIVSRFYSSVEQQVLLEGLEVYKTNDFMGMTSEEKENYLLVLEKEVKDNPKITVTDSEGNTTETKPSYIMIKQLSIWGYKSSEIVAKNGYNYLPIPGGYDGCVEVTDEVKPMYPSPRFGTRV